MKNVLGELAGHVGSLSFSGAVEVATAKATLETPVFEKLKELDMNDWETEEPMGFLLFPDEYDKKMATFYCEFIIWGDRVSEWKENCVVIHFVLLQHTNPELRAYL